MSFNAKKCYILPVCKKPDSVPPFFYELINTVLKEVPSNPYLGVILQGDMKFDEHIGNISKKASQTLGFCQRHLKHAPKELKELAYISLVRSTLDYCAPIWDPYLAKHKDQLEAIQRRAARFVTGDFSRYSSVSAMMRDLNWLPLEERRKLARLALFYKITVGAVGVPASDFLIAADSRTRNSTLTFKHFSTHSEQFRHSFFPKTVKEWNPLPADTRAAPSVESFKHRLRPPRCD